MKETGKIFKGLYYEFAKWLFIISISFSLIIQNVTLLPSIDNGSAKTCFIISTMLIGIFITYYSLRFQFIGIELLNKQSRHLTRH
jgi:hypothetical protein